MRQAQTFACAIISQLRIQCSAKKSKPLKIKVTVALKHYLRKKLRNEQCSNIKLIHVLLTFDRLHLMPHHSFTLQDSVEYRT
jgi:hypothetical protein